MALTPSQINALNITSDRLRIYDPRWLQDMIYFETGGTMDPKKKNPVSSARGPTLTGEMIVLSKLEQRSAGNHPICIGLQAVDGTEEIQETFIRSN